LRLLVFACLSFAFIALRGLDDNGKGFRAGFDTFGKGLLPSYLSA